MAVLLSGVREAGGTDGLLRDLKGANHRMPVFSQFTDFLAIVEAWIQQEVFPFRYLDGVTPPQERERRVAAFQRGEGDLFLLSLKAGGMGLNLTAANYVVLLQAYPPKQGDKLSPDFKKY